MRMFLVGMCDIFLILYLTTLGQFSTYRESHLTVTDYNTVKESESNALSELESSKGKIVDLEKMASTLQKEKELVLKSVQLAKTETEEALERIKLFEAEIDKAKDIEANALQAVESEREKVLQTENALAEALRYKDEIQKLLQDARERERLATKQSNEAQKKVETARRKETDALESAKKAQQDAEKARVNKREALKIAKAAQDQKKIALTKEQEARDAETKALELLKKAQQEAEIAKRNETEALALAKESQQEARKAQQKASDARKNELEAIKVSKIAQAEKKVALVSERNARKAATKALEIANVAQNEVVETRSKIKTITQTGDDAFNENINDKLIQFAVTIEYKNRLKHIKKKVITMQGLPVKIDDNYLIFVVLDQIGLGSSFTTDKYITYNITANNLPITKIYVKNGETKIAALSVSPQVKYSLPIKNAGTLSSYMPVLLAVRSQEILGVMDRIRGINSDFFIFKRDYLRMISMNELYFNNEGIRGTGDYAEYIKKGDQIVDLGGNFIGLAYKKNTILRINQLNGWHEIGINNISARLLASKVRSVIKS